MIPSAPIAPLILTLQLDDAAQEHFNLLRQQHFPSERNFIPAHLTLFHHLPGAEETFIRARIHSLAQRTPAFALTVSGLRSLGRGVAYTLASPELLGFRHTLAEHFQPWLTPQDRQPFKPHITVQNKVDPAAAQQLLNTLSATFRPHQVTAKATVLHRYLGGPWQPIAGFPFPKV